MFRHSCVAAGGTSDEKTKDVPERCFPPVLWHCHSRTLYCHAFSRRLSSHVVIERRVSHTRWPREPAFDYARGNCQGACDAQAVEKVRLRLRTNNCSRQNYQWVLKLAGENIMGNGIRRRLDECLHKILFMKRKKWLFSWTACQTSLNQEL